MGDAPLSPCVAAFIGLLGLAACEVDENAPGPVVDGGPTGGADAGPHSDAGLPGKDDAGTVADAAVTDDGGPPSSDAGTPSSDGGSPSSDAGTPMPEGCVTSVSAGHHVFTCDGIAYDVEVSPTCALGGCGLIVDVHGATMSADVEDRNTHLRALGAARGYVVVQPNAPHTNDLGSTWLPEEDDPKVFAFIELAMRAYRIDVERVHMTGFSQGGFMSWRMLCAHADLFASVAPAAACGPLFPSCAFSETERPSEEIPVLYIHGTEDPIIPDCYDAMRDAVVSGWSMTPSTVVSSDEGHTWTRYESATGTVFEYVRHGYEAFSATLGGHCLPGSSDLGSSPTGWEGFGCVDAAPFAWGESVVSFFEAHPRP